MPIVCIQRPNRTRPRHFTARAVGRAAKYAVNPGGYSPLEVLSCVISALGLSGVVCDDCAQGQGSPSGSTATSADVISQAELAKDALKKAKILIKHPLAKILAEIAGIAFDYVISRLPREPETPSEPAQRTENCIDRATLCELIGRSTCR